MICTPHQIFEWSNPRLRWSRHVARVMEWRGAYRVLVEKPEGKRLLGRTSRRWENNIKIVFQEMGIDLP